MTLDQYNALAAIAEREAGLHMPEAKRSFVASRLQRRLRQTGAVDFDQYLDMVRASTAQGAAERQRFVTALTTNVTSVYREPHHFAILARHLAKHCPRNGIARYRIWSAGCSTGEEPLSIAATCQAVLGPGWTRSVEILATDVDHLILAEARDRIADPALADSLSKLPPDISQTCETLSVRGARLLPTLQAGITYRQHNLLDPLDESLPFNAIFCRNVTIYFSRHAQEAVHTQLRTRLAEQGLIAIGHSEQLLGSSPPLEPEGRTAFIRPPTTTPKTRLTEDTAKWP